MNLIVTGVGGQGNVLASRLLAYAAVRAGWRVAVGETFGASQRGGAVSSHLRLDREATPAPLIPRGRADIVLGLEPLETLRVLLKFGNPDTAVLMNLRPVRPISCLSGQERYPEVSDILGAVRALCPRSQGIEAVEPALALGNAAVANVVLLGALAETGWLPLTRDELAEALTEVLPPKAWELNRLALEAGAQCLRQLGSAQPHA